MRASKGEINRQPICGEIVIVREDGLSRGKWKMAKIVNLVESAVDKVVRAVTIKYPSGRIGKRPLRDIFPLECGLIDEEYVLEQNPNIVREVSSVKPRRVAAEKATKKIQLFYDSSDEYDFN